ncbi:hypothetical protein NH26_18225 [Flammeovirga pacifica]|uniref:Uncharacterized protein n=1 Tax=Flammeovirga pacifica TaxID=915059 RepID=A0A1S1Z4R1_FLAPC|nr:hypothetical protein NH26_18225 [Flammeovirga pacifica]
MLTVEGRHFIGKPKLVINGRIPTDPFYFKAMQCMAFFFFMGGYRLVKYIYFEFLTDQFREGLNN